MNKDRARLLELSERMLIGSLSETYRTCGTPGCRCKTTGPKHGPHLYVSYRGDAGKTTGYYVPAAMHARVREGLDAWKEFQDLAKQLAQRNKLTMDEERGTTTLPVVRRRRK